MKLSCSDKIWFEQNVTCLQVSPVIQWTAKKIDVTAAESTLVRIRISYDPKTILINTLGSPHRAGDSPSIFTLSSSDSQSVVL